MADQCVGSFQYRHDVFFSPLFPQMQSRLQYSVGSRKPIAHYSFGPYSLVQVRSTSLRTRFAQSTVDDAGISGINVFLFVFFFEISKRANVDPPSEMSKISSTRLNVKSLLFTTKSREKFSGRRFIDRARIRTDSREGKFVRAVN